MAEGIRLRAHVAGRVQGVGFRAATRERAQALGLVGSARNLADGRVEVVAEGPRTACEALLAWLRGPDAPGRVAGVEAAWDKPSGAQGFAAR